MGFVGPDGAGEAAVFFPVWADDDDEVEALPATGGMGPPAADLDTGGAGAAASAAKDARTTRAEQEISARDFMDLPILP
ncbi:MAG TPA: hypothetical protein DCG53_11900 [Syntrophus sp. (in: bacteria)]|jgi:hypothetical protein|nr:hypothetical protein [Syntrophus sp. (in: bacteria)]